MIYSYSVQTDVGKKRSQNQDNYAVVSKPAWCAYVVCDGMGGVSGGARASAIAVETVSTFLDSLEEEPTPPLLKRALSEAHNNIFKVSDADPSVRGMGTTICALVCTEKESFWAHVGDSRIYGMTQSSIVQLTEDHTWAAALEASGVIGETPTKSSPAHHMLTRSLGVGDAFEADLSKVVSIQEYSAYLLCSDGLYNYFTEKELHDSISPSLKLKSPSVEEAKKSTEEVLESIVQVSLDKGGADNITGLLILTHVKEDDCPDRVIGFQNEDDLDFSSVVDSYSYDTTSSSVTRSSNSFWIFTAVCCVLLWFVFQSTTSSKNERYEEKTQVATSKSSKKTYEFDFRSLYRTILSVDTDSMRAYLRRKSSEVLSISKEPPKVIIADPKPTSSDELVRPIVWENEASRVQLVRALARDNSVEPQIKPLPSEVYQGDVYDALRRKSALRERIVDIDERMRQMSLDSDQLQRIKKNLQIRRENILSERSKLARVNDSLSEALLEILKVSKTDLQQSKSLLLFLAKLEPTVSSLIDRLEKLENSLKYYRRLLKRTSKPYEIAGKIAELEQEQADLELELQVDAEQILLREKKKLEEYRALLFLADDLLGLELGRVNRSEGMLEGRLTIPAYKSQQTLSLLKDERSRIITQYLSLQNTVDLALELKMRLQAHL